MNAFILIVPFLLIRFGLFGTFNRQTMQRAGVFAPIENNEKIAYYLYQITTVMLVFIPLFLKIHVTGIIFIVGCAVYILGLIILFLSMVGFSKPAESGLNKDGIYRFSRNPMYMAYLIIFLSCVILTHSLVMLIVLIVFQISAHWIILSEERWCLQNFGNEYKEYMSVVRRYV